MAKKIAFSLLAFLVALFAGGYLLPTTYTAASEMQIVASPKMLFVLIGDLSRWKEWTTWSIKDPLSNPQVSKPSYGQGSWIVWNGPKSGAGRIVVKDWSAENALSYEISAAGSDGHHGQLQMSSAAQGASIRWTAEFHTGSNPVSRYKGLIHKWLFSRELHENLAQLKLKAEASSAADYKEPWPIPKK